VSNVFLYPLFLVSYIPRVSQTTRCAIIEYHVLSIRVTTVILEVSIDYARKGTQ
jgi:hypothetical protein